MCGINGLSGKRPRAEAEEVIRLMNNRLAHRGPDDDGIYVEKGIALGHRRLSILDLSELANQPMSDISGRYTLVFNGEIYNFRELRSAIHNVAWRTDGDSEVLLYGLIKEGISFLQKCNGMFSLALWDCDKNQLILARDRMGIKPLYYAQLGDNLIFSSEIRALLASGLVDRRLNNAALGEYLRYQTVHGESTLVEGIYSLPPGYSLSLDDDALQLTPFYNLIAQVDWSASSLLYSDLKVEIRQSLQRAVERRMVSDVPLGIFLSGGIDSSAMVALAAQSATTPINTFTISFEDQEFSEAAYAETVANFYGTKHTELKLSPTELLRQLPDALLAMDHPTGDGINTFVVSKAAKEAGVTVVLSGLGGDELFAGYPIFRQFQELKSKNWLLSFPKFARAAAGSFLKGYKPGAASQKMAGILQQDYFDLEYIYPFSREISPVATNKKLADQGSARADFMHHYLHDLLGFGKPGFDLPRLSKVSLAELFTYLQSVLLRDTDQMSMAHALEVRVPFLDHELWQLILSVEDSLKLSNAPKPLLVDAMGDLLPRSIVERKKMGFTLPWDAWLRAELREFCSDRLTSLSKRDGFHAKGIQSLWTRFLAGNKSVSWARIWYLCTLEAWLENNGIR